MLTADPPLRGCYTRQKANQNTCNRCRLYKGLYPLWARQIPYTMVKFATFEKVVEQIYGQLGRPKESYSTLAQTGVSFAGGYIAGIGCAIVSHPAGTSDVFCDRVFCIAAALVFRCSSPAPPPGPSLTFSSKRPAETSANTSARVPADVMVSKLNAERADGEAAVKAVGRIYGRIGFMGLWNGLAVRIVMLGTLTGFQWLIYDSFKVYLGLPTTGGH